MMYTDSSVTSCSVGCIQGGVKIDLEENIGLVEACIKPFCYKISLPKEQETVMFPSETMLTSHVVAVKFYSNGFVIKELGHSCPAQPFCETVSCPGNCLLLIENPQCMPKIAMLLIFAMIYFSSATLYFLLKSGRILLDCFRIFGKCIFKSMLYVVFSKTRSQTTFIEICQIENKGIKRH